jgi:predicted nucleic acid-binding protein
MRRLFADAFYRMALFSLRDQWHQQVQSFAEALEDFHLYTTDEVLTEFLTFDSAADPKLRRRVAAFVRTMLDDEELTILPQTHAGFLDGLRD